MRSKAILEGAYGQTILPMIDLSFLNGQEKNTVFIIGNGFDFYFFLKTFGSFGKTF